LDLAKSELLEWFDGKNPVKLLDGRYALIIRFYSDTGEVGVQVPREEDIRRMTTKQLRVMGGGAFTEVAAE
jgi:hypothetical protein